MLREIDEQPRTLAATLAHYVRGDRFRPETTDAARHWLTDARELVIAASGSSRHAGLAAELMIEDSSGLHVDVEYASEYAYRSPNRLRDASVIVISQSGGTADTLLALRQAKVRGRPTLAITNVPDSAMSIEADLALPTLAGLEQAIPATKSFTAQMLVLWLVSLLAAEARGERDAADVRSYLSRAAELPALIAAQLAPWNDAVERAAERYSDAASFLFLGRGLHYPIAREGALKLKETAYIHAEGYPAGELKHGPNALLSPSVPLVLLATVDPEDAGSVERYDKSVQLLRDMRAQGAEILAVANAGDAVVGSLADVTIEVAPTIDPLLAVSEVIPLQIFAYRMATLRGIDVDRPRNLVKSVVTE